MHERDLPRAAVDVGRFRFTGFHGCKSWCRIRIYPQPDGAPPVVVATEDGTNPGTSITNAAELIATEVAQRYSLPTFVWIEHYEGVDFDRVEFLGDALGRFREPTWSPLTFEQVLELVGGDAKASGGAPSRRRRGSSPRLSNEERRYIDWYRRFALTSDRGSL